MGAVVALEFSGREGGGGEVGRWGGREKGGRGVEEGKKFDEIIIRRMMMVMMTRMMMVMMTRMMTTRTRTRVVEEHLRSLHCEFLMRCPSSTMSNFQDMPLKRSLSFIDTLVWVGW